MGGSCHGAGDALIEEHNPVKWLGHVVLSWAWCRLLWCGGRISGIGEVHEVLEVTELLFVFMVG